MPVRRGLVDELCFAAEGLSGTAAASSLRRLGSLMQQAPSGRLFNAIATLSEMSVKATQNLEGGGTAIAAGDDHKGALKLARALVHMDDMATEATGNAASEEPPVYLRKSR